MEKYKFFGMTIWQRVKPKTLNDLMEVVTDLVGSLGEAEVRRAMRDVRPRYELCVKMGGWPFRVKAEGIQERIH